MSAFTVDKEARTVAFGEQVFDFDGLIDEMSNADSELDIVELKTAVATLAGLEARQSKVDAKSMLNEQYITPVSEYWNADDQAGLAEMADEAESVKIRNGVLTMTFKVDDIDFGEVDADGKTFTLKEGTWTAGTVKGSTGARSEGASTIPVGNDYRLVNVAPEYEGTRILSRGNGKSKLYVGVEDSEHQVTTLYRSMILWGINPQTTDPKRPWGHAAKYLYDNHLELVVDAE